MWYTVYYRSYYCNIEIVMKLIYRKLITFNKGTKGTIEIEK